MVQDSAIGDSISVTSHTRQRAVNQFMRRLGSQGFIFGKDHEYVPIPIYRSPRRSRLRFAVAVHVRNRWLLASRSFGNMIDAKKALILAQASAPKRFVSAADRVRETRCGWFFPWHFDGPPLVGSKGVVVDKQTGRVVTLGSASVQVMGVGLHPVYEP